MHVKTRGTMLAVSDSHDRLTTAATTDKSSLSGIKQERVKMIKYDETQYLDLIQYILDKGAKKEDRTGKKITNNIIFVRTRGCVF